MAIQDVCAQKFDPEHVKDGGRADAAAAAAGGMHALLRSQIFTALSMPDEANLLQSRSLNACGAQHC